MVDMKKRLLNYFLEQSQDEKQYAEISQERQRGCISHINVVAMTIMATETSADVNTTETITAIIATRTSSYLMASTQEVQ